MSNITPQQEKEEIWKDVVGFEGKYQVSNIGRVKRLPGFDYDIRGYKRKSRHRVMKDFSIKGYRAIKLRKGKFYYNRYVHRLVCESFMPNNENKTQVNHKDFNRENNCIENLEWVTEIENMQHYIKSDKFIPPNKLGRCDNLPQKQPVSQFTTDGHIVAHFQSEMEAHRATGINQNSINCCARGKYRHAGGFIWKRKLESI